MRRRRHLRRAHESHRLQRRRRESQASRPNTFTNRAPDPSTSSAAAGASDALERAENVHERCDEPIGGQARAGALCLRKLRRGLCGGGEKAQEPLGRELLLLLLLLLLHRLLGAGLALALRLGLRAGQHFCHRAQ